MDSWGLWGNIPIARVSIESSGQLLGGRIGHSHESDCFQICSSLLVYWGAAHNEIVWKAPSATKVENLWWFQPNSSVYDGLAHLRANPVTVTAVKMLFLASAENHPAELDLDLQWNEKVYLVAHCDEFSRHSIDKITCICHDLDSPLRAFVTVPMASVGPVILDSFQHVQLRIWIGFFGLWGCLFGHLTIVLLCLARTNWPIVQRG